MVPTFVSGPTLAQKPLNLVGTILKMNNDTTDGDPYFSLNGSFSLPLFHV